jgi:hypothetical protein
VDSKTGVLLIQIINFILILPQVLNITIRVKGLSIWRKALEHKFHKSLEQLAQELIFTFANDPNPVISTNKIDISRYAIGYNKEGEAYPIEKYTTASAADNLLTTIEDYSKFMVSIMKGEGLSKAVFEDMIKNQVVTKKGKHFGLGLKSMN